MYLLDNESFLRIVNDILILRGYYHGMASLDKTYDYQWAFDNHLSVNDTAQRAIDDKLPLIKEALEDISNDH